MARLSNKTAERNIHNGNLTVVITIIIIVVIMDCLRLCPVWSSSQNTGFVLSICWGLHQRVLKWVNRAGDTVKWREWGLSASSSGKWTSLLRNFLTIEEVFITTTSGPKTIGVVVKWWNGEMRIMTLWQSVLRMIPVAGRTSRIMINLFSYYYYYYFDCYYRRERDFLHPSRPALERTQHPIQWVLGLSWG